MWGTERILRMQHLPNKPLKRFALACLTLLMVASFSNGFARADVFVIDTMKREQSFKLAQAIGMQCPACGTIRYMDMKRSYTTARDIVNDLHEREKNGTLDLLITLGKPATEVISREFSNKPIFYSLLDTPLDGYQGSGLVLDFLAEPPVALQLFSLLAMAPGTRKVGFLAHKDSLDPLRDEILKAATIAGVALKFYYIERSEDVGDGLRQAIQETDGLIFVRDKTVINGDTIKFILRLTLENQIPTIGYTTSLVDMGMTAALTAEPNRLGKKIGIAAQAFLTGGKMPSRLAENDLFVLEVNSSSIKQVPGAQPKAPAGMEVVLK